MSALAGFLRSIAEEADDRTARLVLADWLEDRGEVGDAARAELIRVQCELADWVPDLRRRTQLQHREQALVLGNAPDWLGPLQGFCRVYRFRRGLAWVEINARRFAGRPFRAVARQALEQALVEVVRLDRPGAHVAALARASYDGPVLSLDLSSGSLADESLRMLLAAPWWESVLRLDLSNNLLTDESARALAASPLLGRLSALDLRNNRLTKDGARALLDAAPPRLRRLDLHGNDLDANTIQTLAARQRDFIPQVGGLPARLVNSAGMVFVLIPAGTFLMGSPPDEVRHEEDEGPVHEVEITRPFYLGVYPVTQRQYEQVTGENPSEFRIGHGGGPDHPVDNASWELAYTFCRRLSELPGEREAGRVYRLPTEAEWEHACRAGTTTPFSFGRPPSSTLVNYDGSYNYGGAPLGPYLERTTPVGAYPPNAFGLYDMHGNVWEFCFDRYGADYYEHSPRQDPQGPEDGTRRIIRGGCWDCVGWYCRSAKRQKDPPDNADHFNGLRVALGLPGAPLPPPPPPPPARRRRQRRR